MAVRTSLMEFQIPRIVHEEVEDNRGVFVIEPLDRGFGYTFGNSLRRVLLSSLEGAAVTSVKIEGVAHEFTTLPGVREDVTDILLNFKSLICRLHGESPEIEVRLSKKAAGVVKASDIEAPAELEILNPDLEIANLSDKGKLEVTLTIGRGRGYVPAELNRGPEHTIGVIPIDSIFSPVRRVSYDVEAARVGQRTDFDKLTLDIETDGSIDPQAALREGSEILISSLSPGAGERRDHVQARLRRRERRPGRDRARRPGPCLAAGGPRPAHREGAAPARARGDRRAGAGAAHRRALFEVTQLYPNPGCADGAPGPAPHIENDVRTLMLDFQIPRITSESVEENRGQFVVEPLDRGFGYTFGNSLRRVLLASLAGAAVTSVRIEGVAHEFSTIKGVTEDVTDIVLNLKGIVCRMHSDATEIEAPLVVTGPGEITAKDIDLPAGVEILNPDAHIATRDKKTTLELYLTIGRGRGYRPAEENKSPDQPRTSTCPPASRSSTPTSTSRRSTRRPSSSST